MAEMRKETDSLGVVEVPADKLWGARTQRPLEHFSIGKDLMPREMIAAYATLKKASRQRQSRRQAARRPALQIDRSGLRRNSGRPASRYVSFARLDDG